MAIDSAQISSTVRVNYSKTLDLQNTVNQLVETITIKYAAGTGAKQINHVFHDNRSVTSGTPDDIDISGGTIEDPGGDVVTFSVVKLLYIENKSTTNNEDLEVFGDANGLVEIVKAAADIIIVPSASFFLWAAGDAGGATVTATTGDIIQVAATSGTISYDIIIAGH